MNANELRRIISKLPETETQTIHLEKVIRLRKPGRPAWYRSQKEHWLGWLKEYDGPGAYQRENWKRDAAFIYNHIQYAPMLFWLGAALKIPSSILNRAFEAVLAVKKNNASQCAALRREIPWKKIEETMKKRNLI